MHPAMSEPGRASTDVTISVAPSNRSKCQRCKETIEKESTRIGMPARHNGLSVVKWLHPQCFVGECISFDHAPTGRARCAAACERSEIAQGELRLLMDLTSCEGKVTSRKIFHPACAGSLVREMVSLDACSHLSLETICSRGLTEEPRAWALDALRGADMAGRPVPTAEVKPKRRPKRAREAPAADGDGGDGDGELVD